MKATIIFPIILSLLTIHILAASPTPKPYLTVTLWEGTTILLETDEVLAEADLQRGRPIRLVVSSNVVVNGSILIAAGASAEGRVMEKRTNYTSEQLTLKILMDTVQAVDGQRVMLAKIPIRLEVTVSDKDNAVPLGTLLSVKVRSNVKIQA